MQNVYSALHWMKDYRIFGSICALFVRDIPLSRISQKLLSFAITNNGEIAEYSVSLPLSMHIILVKFINCIYFNETFLFSCAFFAGAY